MGNIWEEQPKRRSPMDSGNNGTWLAKLLAANKAKKAAKAQKAAKTKKKPKG